MSDDHCELCDLPRSTCVHGMPAPPAPPKPAAAPRPTRARATTTTSRREPPVRRAPRKWTPPDAMRPHIVAALAEAGGELGQDELFAAMEHRVADLLLPGDRELTPEGELRWQYAARRARQALIAEGVMTRGEPGRWRLAGA